MGDWRKLIGKPVVVTASGVEYRGLLVEMGDKSLILRTARGVQELSWDRVANVIEDRRRGLR